MKSGQPRLSLLIYTCIYIVSSLVLVNILLQISHPISLGVVLIVYSLLMGSIAMVFRVSWFFYLLVLVFLGGVIVLIIYMRTLSSNEKFTPRGNMINIVPILLTYFLRIFLFFNYYYTCKSNLFGSHIFHVYNYYNRSLTIFLMVYLLLTLVRVVKLVKFERGPLVARL